MSISTIRTVRTILMVCVFGTLSPSPLAKEMCPRNAKFNENVMSFPELKRHYESAIFKVYGYTRGDKKIALGTATLIDERGYLLTASHIFEPVQVERNSEGLHVGRLDLFNPTDGMTYKGKVLRQRKEIKTEPDLSVLQITDPAFDNFGYKDHFVDLYLDQFVEVTSGLGLKRIVSAVLQTMQELALFGIPIPSNAVNSHNYVQGSHLSPEAKEIIAVTLKQIWQGESGAIAITNLGQGLGVLKRWDVRFEDADCAKMDNTSECRKQFEYAFERVNADFTLDSVPTSPLVTKILNLVRRGGNPKDVEKALHILEGNAPSSIELVQLETELTKHPEKYPGFFGQRVDVTLVEHLRCRKQYVRAMNFAQKASAHHALSKEILPSLMHVALLANNQLSFELEAGCKHCASDLKAHIKKRSDEALAMAVNAGVAFENYFDKPTNKNHGLTVKERSDFYSDFAIALNKSGIGNPEVAARLDKAIKLDMSNPTPFLALADIQRRNNNFEVAIAASTNAYKLLNVSKNNWLNHTVQQQWDKDISLYQQRLLPGSDKWKSFQNLRSTGLNEATSYDFKFKFPAKEGFRSLQVDAWIPSGSTEYVWTLDSAPARDLSSIFKAKVVPRINLPFQ